MKSMAEIRALPRTMILAESRDGFKAAVELLSNPKKRLAEVIGSWGCWWDHVSVSYPNRTPTWEEMAEIKRMFFRPEEVCIQISPAEANYVNFHSYCLHLWRPQRDKIPTPPYWMVGPLPGQTFADVNRIADAEYRKWEAEYFANT